MSIPPPSAAERFAIILRCLTQAVAGRTTWGNLSRPLLVLIIDRLREINQRFARIAGRVRAGTYSLRRVAPRARPLPPPRRTNRLPQAHGWLLKLVPEAIGFCSQLEHLFRDPEMAALLATAPVSLRRPLRSLCRMLRAEPPPILAAPRPAPRRAAPAATTGTPPALPCRAAPVPPPVAPPPVAPPPARACGPPRRA